MHQGIKNIMMEGTRNDNHVNIYDVEDEAFDYEEDSNVILIVTNIVHDLFAFPRNDGAMDNHDSTEEEFITDNGASGDASSSSLEYS